MRYNYQRSMMSNNLWDNKLIELFRVSDTCSAMWKYQLLERLKEVVNDLKKGKISFEPDELIPRMLAVGRARGTPDFERAVKELLAVLAKKIPSSEYCQEFESFI